MKFTLTDSIKTIKNAIKAFTASGDTGKFSFGFITVETHPAELVKLTGPSGTYLFLNAVISEPGKVSMKTADLVTALKGIEKTPTFVFADDKDNTIEVTEAEVIRMVDGRMVSEIYALKDLEKLFEVTGRTNDLSEERKHRLVRRAELDNQPILKGFCGPVWNGGRLRYEDKASNEILTA